MVARPRTAMAIMTILSTSADAALAGKPVRPQRSTTTLTRADSR
jgi:hypothetical protein